jgi:pyruvate/2-oxoglutarate/acetoin dehydrogenase E1 component
VVIRGPGGVGRQLGAEHSQRLESYFQSIPGVQLVACSTVANAKALLKSAIRSDNPIIFFEHVLLYNVKGRPAPLSSWYVKAGRCWKHRNALCCSDNGNCCILGNGRS